MKKDSTRPWPSINPKSTSASRRRRRIPSSTRRSSASARKKPHRDIAVVVGHSSLVNGGELRLTTNDQRLSNDSLTVEVGSRITQRLHPTRAGRTAPTVSDDCVEEVR